MESTKSWNDYFMDLARVAASKSKDPSTKVGCVVVRPDRSIVSLGYNGFPRGVNDGADRYADRPTKYAFVVHAEANAIVASRTDLTGCWLYCTLFPCQECAKLIIQAGIEAVYCPEIPEEGNWQDSMKNAMMMFAEARVMVLKV